MCMYVDVNLHMWVYNNLIKPEIIEKFNLIEKQMQQLYRSLFSVYEFLLSIIKCSSR